MLLGSSIRKFKIDDIKPLSKRLNHCNLIIHHGGGLGTLPQAIKASVPQIVAPKAFDQFDNAYLIGESFGGKPDDELPVGPNARYYSNFRSPPSHGIYHNDKLSTLDQTNILKNLASKTCILSSDEDFALGSKTSKDYSQNFGVKAYHLNGKHNILSRHPKKNTKIIRDCIKHLDSIHLLLEKTS